VLVNLKSATERAFAAAFFFLPVSKALLFISFLVALSLFVAEGGMRKDRQAWRTLPWMAPAAILAVLPLLSLVVHDDLERGISNLGLGYYWLMALMTYLASIRMSVLPWMRAFLCGVFVAFLYAQLARAGYQPIVVEPSALANTILYSQFLAIGIVLCAILFKYEARRGWKIVFLAGMGLFFLGLLQGQGRSGMLAVLILLPMIFSNLFGRQNLGRVAIGCVIAGIVMLMSPQVQTRIGEAVNDVRMFEKNVSETSIGYRFEMWRTATEVFLEHPVVGAGTSGFTTAWNKVPRNEHASGFVEPHNAFLFYASSYGAIALVALIWLYIALFRTAWANRHSLEGSILLAFAVICIAGSFTNTMFMGAASHAWLMLFIGLQGALLRGTPAPLARKPLGEGIPQ
jgi:O-antigen ligase